MYETQIKNESILVARKKSHEDETLKLRIDSKDYNRKPEWLTNLKASCMVRRRILDNTNIYISPYTL